MGFHSIKQPPATCLSILQVIFKMPNKELNIYIYTSLYEQKAILSCDNFVTKNFKFASTHIKLLLTTVAVVLLDTLSMTRTQPVHLSSNF